MKKVILIILAVAAVVAMLSYTAFSHSQQQTPAATAEPVVESVNAAPETPAPDVSTPEVTESPEGPMPGLGDFEPLEVVDEMEIELEPDQDLAYAGG